MLCSNATIPVSSATSEDRKSRADIAASFQVTNVYLYYSSCHFDQMFALFRFQLYLFYIFCNLEVVPCAESCRVTFRRKVRTSN